MDNYSNGDDNVGIGTAYLTASVIIGFIGWIGTFDTSDIIKGASMCLSGGAAILAGVYWWFAIKDKRMDIKRKRKEEKK